MSGEGQPTSPEHIMQAFEGTYIGIGPTDESAVGVGEISIAINGSGVHTRWATGLEIQEDKVAIDEVRELSPAEVVDLFMEGEAMPNTRAFDVNGLTYMFIPSDDPTAPFLWVTGSMGDLLAPTALFSPSQVEKDLHETTFKQLEEAHGIPGAVPRLHNNGLATQER